MPSQATAARDQTDASCKIKRIKGPPIDRHDIAVGARLLDTWLGRVYTSHLRQYSAARRLADWVWRNGYPIYVNLFVVRFSNREEKGWRPLAKLGEFARKSGIPTHKLADAALVETPAPKVFPACDQGCLASPHDRYEFPEIFVATIKDAMVYGGTNLVLADGEVVMP